MPKVFKESLSLFETNSPTVKWYKFKPRAKLNKPHVNRELESF